MKLDVLDKAGALSTIAAELHLMQAPQTISAAVICEHIRAIVLLGSASEDGLPYSQLKAERIAYQRVAPLLKDDLSEFELARAIKTEINHLLNLQDLVETPNGLTISPPRLIALNERACLLIGGGPVQSLPVEIRAALTLHARSRIISIGAKNKKLLESLPWQSAQDWLSLNVTNQSAWCASLRSQARKKMTDVADIEQVEVFENGFWTNLGRIRSTPELVLVRYKQSLSARLTYALASIVADRGGITKVSKAFDLEYDAARRLQGYLPTHGQKAPLQFVRMGEFLEVAVGHPLARPECRFLSLGWFTQCKPSHEWPRRYWFSLHIQPLLKIAIESLGFALTEVSTLGKKNEKY